MARVKIQGEKLAFALERLWGWPTKLAKRAFPNFGAAHIVPHWNVPRPQSMTIWMWADPHGDRNWFMNWTGVDEHEELWTFAEWPNADVGEWALPGPRPDGKPGPATTAGGGKAFEDYKKLILEIEGWAPNAQGIWTAGPDAWNVFDHQMDPRPAGTSVPGEKDARTYLDYMNDPITDVRGKAIGPGIEFRAGVDCGIEEGKGWVNNWVNFGWDANAEVTPMNCPKWHISERCANTIYALRSYTGVDGLKGATKDPIDCLKGLSKTGLRWMPAGALGTTWKPRGY